MSGKSYADLPGEKVATRYTLVMRKILKWALLVLLLGGVGYVAYTHQGEVGVITRGIEGRVAPCTNPITYSVGSIDPRFGISKEVFINDLKEAETIWEKPSGKNLFEYVQSSGDVTVNLIYDNRQAATDTLKTLGIQTDKSQASYDALKATYDSRSTQVEAEQSNYTNQVNVYRRDEDAYNAEVKKWNDLGGAPPAEYQRLQSEKSALAEEFTNIQSLESTLNVDINTLNALATALNQLIVQLNLNVAQYNRAGASTGEFEEGLYQLSGGVQTIDVYEYSDHVQLVRVLAHEMGHALGLEHVPDSKAIMYKINSGTNLAVTAADMSELNRVCTPGK